MTRLRAGLGLLLLLPACVSSNDSTRFEQSLSCDVPHVLLLRQWRGYVPGRSGDVLLIERQPHHFGTRHSTPYAYTQDVPLLLYGPGFIRAGVEMPRPVTVADLAPTFAELLRFEQWPERDGRVLGEALLPEAERNGTPRLVVTVVWDGGGDNVLEYWPRAWPHLRRLQRAGASYERATLGSSPSITPAVHATIGTGAWPLHHGISEIKLRTNGRLGDSWASTSPENLLLSTLSDLWDRARSNEPRIGILARDGWHVGMMGHGAFLGGGDRDIAALDDLDGVSFRTNRRFYSLPPYLLRETGLRAAIRSVDRADGKVDGTWLGNEVLDLVPEVRSTSAWPIYQTKRIVEILEKQGFGGDGVSDLFFTNFKSTDLAGHAWNMVTTEVEATLRAQDRELAVLVRELNRLVGRRNYVLALTADHGMTPTSAVSGGWSIDPSEVSRDIDRAFGLEPGERSLVALNRGYQIFLDQRALAANGVDPAEVAGFLADYRLRDNAPQGEERGDYAGDTSERMFLSALTPTGLRASLGCSRK